MERVDRVGIADLKSRLSEYLRKVRGGRPIVVLDRDRPIAQIIPYEEQGLPKPQPLRLRIPAAGTPSPGKVALPPPLGIRVDVLELLREERQGDR